MPDVSPAGAISALSGPSSAREIAVLRGVVETYLATGAPVGSHYLADHQLSGTSSATIRHVLSELDRTGFLLQPHTSAGRLPTSQAIRWWLQRLTAPTPLADATASLGLERALRAAGDETSLWLRTSEFLSDLTQQVAMVAVLPWRDAGLRQLRFFRLTEHRVLAILVTADGHVREHVGRIPEVYSQAELDVASRYFVQNFCGMTLARIRRELVRRLEEERAAYDDLLKRVLVLSHCGVLAMQDNGEVYIQGTRHLADGVEAGRLGDLLAQLQQKERWLHLLAGIVPEPSDVVQWQASGQHGRWLRARVGMEHDQMPELSLLAADYGAGAIGILGPTRMPYERALAALALVQTVCQRVLGEQLT
ncbi:MAG: HrcA family transcriptional regulator [Terriglobales bacterium]